MQMLPADMHNYHPREIVEAIMIAFQIERSEWTLGASKLFLKAGQLRVLEDLRDQGSTASQDMLRHIRRLFARKKIRRVRNALGFCRWFPRHVRAIKKERNLRRLVVAVHVAGRLFRWLKKARK